MPFNETEQGDKTAANDIRFMCHNNREIDGRGNNDGVWGDYSDVCEPEFVEWIRASSRTTAESDTTTTRH